MNINLNLHPAGDLLKALKLWVNETRTYYQIENKVGVYNP